MYGFNIFSGDDWLHLFNTILLAPMQGLCYIIFFAEQVFITLSCGFMKDGKQINLVEVILEGSTVQKIILGSFVLAIFLVLLFAIIAVIKQYTNYKEEPNTRTVAGDSIKSFAIMLCVPLVAFGCLYLINSLTGIMYSYLGGTTGVNPANSIANHLFITLGNWKKDAAGNPITPAWFGAEGAWDIVGKYYPSMDLGNYQYIIGYVTGFILFFNLGKAAMQAGKRLFDVALLYAVAPVTTSTYPVDQGKRWNVWVNLFISKLTQALVMIYSFFIYIAFMEVLKNELGIQGTIIDFSNPTSQTTINNICYIMLLITGAMATSGAPTLIGHLISEQAGSLAAADASAIDSDLKWGTMMGGKMLGAACGVAKDLYQGSGGGGGAGGGRGALHGTGIVGGIERAVGGVAHPFKSIGNLRQQGRANKLNDLRNQMMKNYGSTSTKGIRDFKSASRKYKQMTGESFNGADALLKKAQARSAMGKAGINNNWNAKDALSKAKQADKAAKMLDKGRK